MRTVCSTSNCLVTKQKIGSGGYAKVYAGFLDGEVVAVKKSVRPWDEGHYCIYREIDALVALKGAPNIVQFRGWIVENQEDTFNYYLVLDYHENTLCSLLDLPDSRRLELLPKFRNQLVTGLQCIHNAGLIHRDIRSENILITDDNLCIADFGVARRVNDNSISLTNNWSYYAFAAPEIEIDSQNYTKAIDIWALGIVLLGFANGNIAPLGDGPIYYLERVLRYELAKEWIIAGNFDGIKLPISNLVNSEVEQLISEMLFIDPESRRLPDIDVEWKPAVVNYAASKINAEVIGVLAEEYQVSSFIIDVCVRILSRCNYQKYTRVHYIAAFSIACDMFLFKSIDEDTLLTLIPNISVVQFIVYKAKIIQDSGFNLH
jgi:serine/threonine protein kinase